MLLKEYVRAVLVGALLLHRKVAPGWGWLVMRSPLAPLLLWRRRGWVYRVVLTPRPYAQHLNEWILEGVLGAVPQLAVSSVYFLSIVNTELDLIGILSFPYTLMCTIWYLIMAYVSLRQKHIRMQRKLLRKAGSKLNETQSREHKLQALSMHRFLMEGFITVDSTSRASATSDASTYPAADTTLPNIAASNRPEEPEDEDGGLFAQLVYPHTPLLDDQDFPEVLEERGWENSR